LKPVRKRQGQGREAVDYERGLVGEKFAEDDMLAAELAQQLERLFAAEDRLEKIIPSIALAV